MAHKVACVLVGCLVAAGLGSGSWALSWTVEQVTTDPEDDWSGQLAIDDSGVLHVAYTHEDPDNEIFYATNGSGAWQVSRVTDDSWSDIALGIAVAPDRTAHIAYQGEDGTDIEIYHAAGRPGAWVLERVTDNVTMDYSPSICRGRDGFLHIAYSGTDPGGTDQEIFYATNKPGYWVREQVTFNGDEDIAPALALDGDGDPSVAYIREVAAVPAVRYARRVAGIWSDVLVAPPYAVDPSLALDPDGFAHIAYSGADPDAEVYYANNVTGSWQVSQVTSNAFQDGRPTLVLDRAGHAYIVYQIIDGDYEVGFAHNATGVWQVSRVTDNADDDRFAGRQGFATDRDGYAHVLFDRGFTTQLDVFHARSDVPIHAGLQESPAPRVAALRLVTRPEPCAGAVVVRYDLPAAGTVGLAVFDAAGRHVTALASGMQSVGSHQVVWNTASIAPGVYFCQLTTNDADAVGRITVMH